MKHLRATPPCKQSRSTYMSEDLQTCTHAFIRHDAVKTPLQAPYDGPNEILRTPKHFTLKVNGHKLIFHWID